MSRLPSPGAPVLGALEGWLRSNPGWIVGEVRAEGAATVVALSREPGRVSLRVEPRDDRKGAALRGPRWQVGAPEPPADTAVFDALAKLLVAADEAGALGVPGEAGGPAEAPGAAPRLEFFIANGCNLHCRFCCESERIARKGTMEWSELAAGLAAAAARGTRVVQFMGGEATLHPRFVEACAEAKRLGMRTYVITNVLRWEDRGFAEAVSPVLDEAMVSMHAHGAGAGGQVYGRAPWWTHFQAAMANFGETFAGTVHASTVLTRFSAPDLDRIADAILGLRPRAWVLGSAVPIAAARADAIDDDLRLDELRAMHPRLLALRERARAAGCRLVFFCIPDCVLGPELWEDSHDGYVGDQDLGAAAPGDTASVNFWSRADYLDAPRAVTLGRTRPPACDGCARAGRCGGYFTDYFARFGEGELRPVGG